ncbi:MAG: hypothetical protein A2677_01690 [Candidatus Komeilibacteria bacterium RIFCSPHIGHO2_01_FULL_52_14]|uniref:Glutamate--cysteine ligase n=1 Tax=Candidatus Komeilibacteria bacterium RIFCSPHIGHO2_01_FULL_52_14 TaxID=1798549 RepID=A0A1G2BMJ6_9BACT|nr:MAG: hypothetical protein A2677_01690 [Candidatus Komeilibacteria bacterium RIFCSPHIGHO2_01_FULL_52_14]
MFWPETTVDRLRSVVLAGFPERIDGPRTVGTEEELLLVNSDGTMGSTEVFFRFFADEPGWTPVHKDGILEGFKHPDLGYLTTDAGLGTLELDLAPSHNLHVLALRQAAFIKLVVRVAKQAGFLIYGSGINPVTEPHETLWQRKVRYRIIIDRFSPNVHMAPITASTQVHVAITRDEIIPVTTIMNAMTGPLIALMQNSPIWKGKEDEHGRSAVREELWDEICDPNRVTLPPRRFASVDDYLFAMLSCETFMLPDPHHPERFIRCDVPLGEVLGANHAPQNYLKRIIAIHEGTVWWDSRPRCVFGTEEVRMCCQQPQQVGIGVAVLIAGVITAWRGLATTVDAFPWEFWKRMRKVGIREGLNGRVDGILVGDIAKALVATAYTGLYQRDLNEAPLLKEMSHRLTGGKPVPAETARSIFRKEGVPGLVQAFAYC